MQANRAWKNTVNDRLRIIQSLRSGCCHLGCEPSNLILTFKMQVNTFQTRSSVHPRVYTRYDDIRHLRLAQEKPQGRGHADPGGLDLMPLVNLRPRAIRGRTVLYDRLRRAPALGNQPARPRDP